MEIEDIYRTLCKGDKTTQTRRRSLMKAAATASTATVLSGVGACETTRDPRRRPLDDVLWSPEDIESAPATEPFLFRDFDQEFPLPEGADEPYPRVDAAETQWMIYEPFSLNCWHLVLVADDKTHLDDYIREQRYGEYLEDPTDESISISANYYTPWTGEDVIRRVERRGNVLSYLAGSSFVGPDITESQIDTEKGVMQPWK